MGYYKNKFIIFIIVILAVLAAMIAFIICPAVKEITQVNREIKKEKNNLEKKLALGFNLKQIKQDLDEIQGSIEELDKIFIQQGQELKFVTELENLASRRQLSLNLNPDFESQPANNGIKPVPLQISITGSYPQILRFMQDLEALPYYYNLELIIASAKTAKEGGLLSFQLMGQTYLKQYDPRPAAQKNKN